MTPSALAAHLYSTYEPFRLNHLRPANCRHGVITTELHEQVGQSGGLLRVEELGRSTEERSIFLVSCGRGPTCILLWSQMHGDESTATLALLDIFNFLRHRAASENWIREMLEEITIHAIPMLNPDGAERRQRQTALKIDMNRDARTLITPEARLLRDTQRKLNPSFGFNLHDQDLSSVGSTDEVAALALLAPALDEKRSTPLVRVRALRLVSLLTSVLEQFIAGHVTTYDDTFEPRAFGDSMQSWGTSTVLIESGHWPKDPEKLFIRKLNFLAILTALRSIGNGSYQDADLDYGAGLRPNGKRMFDIIIRGVRLEHPSGWAQQADLGLLFPPSQRGRMTSADAQSPMPTLVIVKEVGDLEGNGALEMIEGHGRRISTDQITIDKEVPFNEILDVLQLYYSPAPQG